MSVKISNFLKFFFASTIVMCGSMLIVSVAFAANVTVSDTNVTLVLPTDSSTYSLASTNTFDNLVINSTNFVFTLPVGASIFVTSLLSDRALDNTLDISTTCGTGESTLLITNSTGSQEVVTITPGSTCVPTTTTNTTPAPTPAAHFYGQSQSHSAVSAVASNSQTSTSVTTTTSVTSTSVSSIPRDLTVNSTGSDVKMLQQFLNAEGFTIAKTGAGSAGNETTFFGALTKAALIRFQKYYGITPASGYFGPITRAFIKKL